MSESNGARKLRLAEEFEGESGAVEGEVDLSGLEYPQDGEDVNVTHLVKSINYTAEHNDQRYRHQFEVPVYLVVAGEGRHAIMTGDFEFAESGFKDYEDGGDGDDGDDIDFDGLEEVEDDDDVWVVGTVDGLVLQNLKTQRAQRPKFTGREVLLIEAGPRHVLLSGDFVLTEDGFTFIEVKEQ